MAQRSARVPALRQLVAALLLASCVSSTFVPRRANADEKVECIDAHGQAQLLRRSGRMRAARERLLACSAASCPILVSRDCTSWLRELDAEQPTVILAAHDEAGRDVDAVSVTLDGALLTKQLDGRPLEVDPGSHVFRGEFANGRIVESRVVVRATEKDRFVRLDLAVRAPEPAEAPPPAVRPASSASSSGPPLGVILLGSLGAVALGSFAYFGLRGRADESDLAATCGHKCGADDVSGVRRSYLVADISLGVAIIALGAATYLALTSRRSPP
ncbi:MAG: hypothetical protein JWP87_785 [Labilithrix sp.]|nr:hypothetical protein [Labilithrix sp.]